MDQLIHIVITLAIAALVFWLLYQLIALLPISPRIKQIGHIVLLVLAILWLIRWFFFGGVDFD